MKKLSKRDQRALIVLGGVGVVIFAVIGVILPFYDATAQMADELEEKEDLLGRYIQVLQEEGMYGAKLGDLDQSYRNHILKQRFVRQSPLPNQILMFFFRTPSRGHFWRVQVPV